MPITNKWYSSEPETLEHIENVSKSITEICAHLVKRAEKHDASKLKAPELKYFNKYTPLLKKMEYGSEGFKKSLEELKPALDHHYRNNSHHHEHYRYGVDGMNLMDIIEMFCDWQAASKRTKNGSMLNSINVSCKRFFIDNQLRQIFINTYRDIIQKGEQNGW